MSNGPGSSETEINACQQARVKARVWARVVPLRSSVATWRLAREGRGHLRCGVDDLLELLLVHALWGSVRCGSVCRVSRVERQVEALREYGGGDGGSRSEEQSHERD